MITGSLPFFNLVYKQVNFKRKVLVDIQTLTCKNRFKLGGSIDLETLNALNSCSVLCFNVNYSIQMS